MVHGEGLETGQGVISAVQLLSADEAIIAQFEGLNFGDTVTRLEFEQAWTAGPNSVFELLLRGDDFIDGADGNDTLIGGDGNDSIVGYGGINTIIAGGGDDDIVGGDFENYIEPGSGNDTIDGGGDDPQNSWAELSYINGATTGIRVEFNSAGRSGSVTNDGHGGTDTFTRIDAVRGTNFADVFIGGTGAGVQRFMGYGGDDVFDGTLGINEVDYRADARAVNFTDGMVINLSQGDEVEIVDPTGHTDTLIMIERVRGTDYNDEITGNSLHNRLRGDGGNDTIDGGVGDDRLEGGAGDDSIEGGDGHDNLFGDAGNDTLDGGNGINNLYGGAGNDILRGGTFENYIEGGAGDDTIVGAVRDDNTFTQLGYSGATAGIVVTFSNARDGQVSNGQDGTDTFSNVHAVGGTHLADHFIGGGTAAGPSQRFIGFGGNDTFDGTNGVNEVDYRADARAAGRTTGMIIDVSGGLDVNVIDARGDTDRLISIERIRGTEYDDRIIGNSLNNRLRGDVGNDILRGGAGNDRVEGGAGSDTAELSGSRSDYAVILNGDGTLTFQDKANRDGTDTMLEVEFFRFGTTVLSLAEVLNNGTGISLANGMVQEGSSAGQAVGTLSVANPDANSQHSFQLLDSAGGRFRIGADGKSLEVANGILLDYEQSQFHSVTVRATDQFGKVVDATLTVALLDRATERTTGTGGKGLDTLTGGKGKDVFVFGNKDTGTSKMTADYITDFKPKEQDRIDLKAIDADTKKKGDQAFSFIGKGGFTKAGQVRYEKTSKETLIYLNTDADKAAEGVIRLKGAMDLQKGWFVL